MTRFNFITIYNFSSYLDLGHLVRNLNLFSCRGRASLKCWKSDYLSLFDKNLFIHCWCHIFFIFENKKCSDFCLFVSNKTLQQKKSSKQNNIGVVKTHSKISNFKKNVFSRVSNCFSFKSIFWNIEIRKLTVFSGSKRSFDTNIGNDAKHFLFNNKFNILIFYY